MLYRANGKERFGSKGRILIVTQKIRWSPGAGGPFWNKEREWKLWRCSWRSVSDSSFFVVITLRGFGLITNGKVILCLPSSSGAQLNRLPAPNR